MTNKKYLLLLAPTILLTSCSNLESFDQKMARYQSREKLENKVPEFPAAEFKSVNRTIASETTQVAPTEMNMKDVTNKKLYFQSLYSQYLNLAQFIPEKDYPVLETCPQFHSNFLETKNQTISKVAPTSILYSYDAELLADKNYTAKHPELYLPVSSDDQGPKVIDLLKAKPELKRSEQSDIVKMALTNHLGKTYQEVKELCEYGVSQNYYIFENLMTYSKTKGIHSNQEGVKILLKTTLFSNQALKTSLSSFYKENSAGRFPASKEIKKQNLDGQEEVMKRLNVVWMKDYYQNMKN